MNKDKREKVKEEKENHPIKHKLKKWLTFYLCLVMVLLTAVYITYLLTHKDTNRNTNTYNESSNVSLIEKNMIDAFSNTKDTGKFSFRLSDQDINQMLKNASNNVLPSNAESIYYESKDNHHYFYIDLKPKLLVSTRVVIDTYIERVTSNKEVVLQINNVTMGKFTYRNKFNYLNEDFFNKLEEYSLLPIKYSRSTKTIITYPLKLMSYFPTGEYTNILKELINLKPEVIKPTTDSLFGFDIDFSSFRSEKHSNPNRSEEVVDIKQRVESSITEDFLTSIPSEESRVPCLFTLGELNRLIYNNIDVLDNEIHEHSLTSNVCVLKISDVSIYIESTNFIYRVSLSINGYEIDFDIKSKVFDSNTDLTLLISTGDKVKCGGNELDVNNQVSTKIKGYLEEVLTKFASKYDYIKYLTSDLSLIFDFSYLEDVVYSLLFYDTTIKVNYLDPITFEFIITNPF